MLGVMVRASCALHQGLPEGGFCGVCDFGIALNPKPYTLNPIIPNCVVLIMLVLVSTSASPC